MAYGKDKKKSGASLLMKAAKSGSKGKKKNIKIKSSRGDRSYSSVSELKKDKKMQGAVNEDKMITKAPTKTLKSMSNRIHLPTRSLVTGKVIQGTEVQDKRKKLAKTELNRRKKAKSGNNKYRISGQDSPGGNY